ncbi:hypothetical protein Scep_028247 [Stephania cephalantha]|uniref:Uncharacterized protein n=1 Tax=Stephania cephalantha TaxID=152367 RepID=A0AAP0EBR6_9MAGN
MVALQQADGSGCAGGQRGAAAPGNLEHGRLAAVAAARSSGSGEPRTWTTSGGSGAVNGMEQRYLKLRTPSKARTSKIPSRLNIRLLLWLPLEFSRAATQVSQRTEQISTPYLHRVVEIHRIAPLVEERSVRQRATVPLPLPSRRRCRVDAAVAATRRRSSRRCRLLAGVLRGVAPPLAPESPPAAIVATASPSLRYLPMHPRRRASSSAPPIRRLLVAIRRALPIATSRGLTRAAAAHP